MLTIKIVKGLILPFLIVLLISTSAFSLTDEDEQEIISVVSQQLQAFQDDDLNVEIDMKEESVMVHTGANTYKQDDFTRSVKKQKKFKYVPAKHGDNALVNNDKVVDESAFNELMNEYKNFVAESEHSKKKTEK